MYEITEYGPDGKPRTDTVIVDAPSPGTAIEYFLACHGMLNYYDIVLDEVNVQATVGYELEDVLGLMGDDFTMEEIDQLDEYHTWRSRWSREWPERGWYWFYGQTHKSVSPKMTLLEVYDSGVAIESKNDDYLYARYVYPEEMRGVWTPCTRPSEPPAIPVNWR